MTTIKDFAATLRHYADNCDGVLCVAIENLRVPIVVQDARTRFGQWDVLITPVGGYGHQWVESDRLRCYSKRNNEPLPLATLLEIQP